MAITETPDYDVAIIGCGVAGDELQTLTLKDRGWIVDLGGGTGVAELLGIPIASPGIDRIVPVLHELIDVRNLWQMGGVDFVQRFGSSALRQLTLARA